MTLYDILLKEMEKELPSNFTIEYNNTLDTNWADILPEEYDNLVHGVLRVDSSSNEYIGIQTVKKENLRLTLVIPNTKDEFSNAINSIEEFMASFNDSLIPVAVRYEENGTETPTEIVTKAHVIVGGRSDGAIERINGVDWITVDIYLQTEIFEGLITSDKVQLTIDSNALDVGVVDVVYDYTSSMEAKILGETQVPTNLGTGNQKQLILTVIPQVKPVYQGLLENEDNANKVYSISYNNGIITRTFSAKLVGINEHVVAGGTYVATIKFLRTN